MLARYLPPRTYAVVSAYEGDALVGVIAAAEIGSDDAVDLEFPKVNPFRDGQALTIHLDNRTGVESFTPELLVYRASVKASATRCREGSLRAVPVEYELRYSDRVVDSFKAPGWEYPRDARPPVAPRETPLKRLALADERERDNKLGVWITRAADRPHTTVMAFLSSVDDDIFLISHADTFKSKCLARDGRCLYAIDHRASYRFEKAIDWNYTIIRGETFTVPRSNPLFEELQARFVEKNPWELGFFTDPKVVLHHVRPLEVMCPEKYARSVPAAR
ncbi:MAG: hypothetical protein KBC36_08730 [Spirochaetia bacterium]|nr:hypothetical protein [Spirochaetia bacterium]